MQKFKKGDYVRMKTKCSDAPALPSFKTIKKYISTDIGVKEKNFSGDFLNGLRRCYFAIKKIGERNNADAQNRGDGR